MRDWTVNYGNLLTSSWQKKFVCNELNSSFSGLFSDLPPNPKVTRKFLMMMMLLMTFGSCVTGIPLLSYCSLEQVHKDVQV